MYRDLSNTRYALAPSTCLNHKYIINDILGKGGFGITYIGNDITTNKTVAIKEYSPKEELAHGRQRFLNEAKILKEFHHLESIVSIYDVFEENNTAYIVMEYIEGPTLKQYIDENGPMCFAILLSLMTPVMQDLSVIHKRKLIHRDISPDNLILGTDNRLHLIDFGAASHEDIDGSQHTVILKSGYAPPEQYIPDSKTGAWIDVYALCATMYFALTGKPPYEAIKRYEQDSLNLPDTLTDILPWQKNALKKGLDINMSRRFRNMDELYNAITVAPETETQVTVTGISLTRKEKQKIRHMRYRIKMPLLFSFVLFLLSGTFLITYIIKSQQPPKEKTTAQATTLQTSSPSPDASASELPSLLSMPKLSGLTLKIAKKAIKNLDDNIHIETAYVYNDDIKKDLIIYQSIAEGTLFSSGRLSDILLTISLGKKPKVTSKPKNTKKPAQKIKDNNMQNTKDNVKSNTKNSEAKNNTTSNTPKTKETTAPKTTETPKKSSPSYHLTPEDDEFVTIPLG